MLHTSHGAGDAWSRPLYNRATTSLGAAMGAEGWQAGMLEVRTWSSLLLLLPLPPLLLLLWMLLLTCLVAFLLFLLVLVVISFRNHGSGTSSNELNFPVNLQESRRRARVTSFTGTCCYEPSVRQTGSGSHSLRRDARGHAAWRFPAA